MDTSLFYIPSCTKDDIKQFIIWLESEGFRTLNHFVYFKGADDILSRGHFGVRINEEYQMWSFAIGNEPAKLLSAPWYEVQDVATYLGKPTPDALDPALIMKFLHENLVEVQQLLETKPFAPVAIRLRELAIERMDRMHPKGKPRQQ